MRVGDTGWPGYDWHALVRSASYPVGTSSYYMCVFHHDDEAQKASVSPPRLENTFCWHPCWPLDKMKPFCLHILMLAHSPNGPGQHGASIQSVPRLYLTQILTPDPPPCFCAPTHGPQTLHVLHDPHGQCFRQDLCTILCLSVYLMWVMCSGHQDLYADSDSARICIHGSVVPE